MAVIRPFHGLRYNEARFPDLAAVLAPPYDVINAAEQQALYDRHPANVIRLEYGVQRADDSETDNRYTRACTALQAWMADQTLAMDARPCLYPHRQRYTWGGETRTREGFFAAVELQPFDQGDVLPHEWTLKGPKEDRLRLMRTCLASFSPVFGLYDGRNSEVGAVLASASTASPLVTARGHGFDEAMWRIDDGAATAAISEALAKRQILIADGHHRYETMLALRDVLRREFPEAPPTAAFNYTLMLLVDIHDPGLLVLPTYRLLQLTPAMCAGFCRIAADRFESTDLAVAQPEQVIELLARHTDEHAFICYMDGVYRLLTAPKTLKNGLPVLDVVALQEWLVAPLLALDAAEDASVERNVRYTISPREAVARVDRGEAQAAVFLNPTPVPEVLTLAANGIRLPQKSTYFYPKVPTGLVMHNLRPNVTVG